MKMIYTNDLSLDKKRIRTALAITLSITLALLYFSYNDFPFAIIGMVVSSLSFYIVLRTYIYLKQNKPDKLYMVH